MVRRLIALALVVPPLWGAVWTSRDVAVHLLSRSPESSGGPQNIAEAAGLGDGAEVLRMLRRGDDLHRVLPLRPETISSSVLLATVLEAAVWGRRIELIRLLEKEGAFVGEDPTRIGCLAQDLGADDIAEYLAAGDTCVPDAALESVLKRTRELAARDPGVHVGARAPWDDAAGTWRVRQSFRAQRRAPSGHQVLATA